jgi:hypothetical protein
MVMSPQETIAHWQEEISTHLPHLSRPQTSVLALWSYGMVMSKSCGITTVVGLLARVFRWTKGNVRQRLREWCYDAEDKKGEHRAQVEVEACFAPLVGWIIDRWAEGEEHELALALDATTLSDRFTVLTVSMQYRGCAIPVAWYVMRAGQKGAWRPHWERLLQAVAAGIPTDWWVVVMADRGLYAPWLYEQIVSLGWHPFLRINESMAVRSREEEGEWKDVTEWVKRPGESWCGKVECGKEERVCCTVLEVWEPGYEERWIVVTDLEPQEANVAWYQMRFWIEGGFKDQKRGGWQWHHTKMRDPSRASRLWLVMAVATILVVGIGGKEEAEEQADREATQTANSQEAKPDQKQRGREESCFLRGRLVIEAVMLRAEALPVICFVPEPWPSQLQPLLKEASSWVKKRRHKEQKRREKARRKQRRREQKRRQKTYP